MHEGHREKLKQRFLKEGRNAFEDHSVGDASILYNPRRDTNEMAHRL